MPCIVCGKKRHLKKIEMPKGSFEVCFSGMCEKKLVLKMLGYYPVAGFSTNEFTDSETFTSEELEAMHLTEEDEIDLASYHADVWWNNDLVGDSYREATDITAIEAERMSLSRIPRKELPLKIGDLKYKENEAELEKLLKEVPKKRR